MYTIVMDKYKNLNTTIKAVIYKQENLVDKIQFLIPPKYSGNEGVTKTDPETGEEVLVQDGVIDLSSYTAVLKYVDPNGNFHSEVLIQDAEMYKDYLRYTLPVNTKLTQVCGNVTVRITFSEFVDEQNVPKLETNSTIIHVDKPKGFDDYVNFEDIEAYKAEIAKLKENMPTDLAIGEHENLHLVHDDRQIGEGVEILMPTQFEELDSVHDGIINVDDVEPEPQGNFIEL